MDVHAIRNNVSSKRPSTPAGSEFCFRTSLVISAIVGLPRRPRTVIAAGENVVRDGNVWLNFVLRAADSKEARVQPGSILDGSSDDESVMSHRNIAQQIG